MPDPSPQAFAGCMDVVNFLLLGTHLNLLRMFCHQFLLNNFQSEPAHSFDVNTSQLWFPAGYTLHQQYCGTGNLCI